MKHKQRPGCPVLQQIARLQKALRYLRHQTLMEAQRSYKGASPINIGACRCYQSGFVFIAGEIQLISKKFTHNSQHSECVPHAEA